MNRTQLKNLALISVSGLGLVEVTGWHYGLGEWGQRLTCAESIYAELKPGRLASVRAKVVGSGKLPAQPTRYQLMEG